MAHQGYGFCEFQTEEDAEYACKIMNQIKLWGKPIRVNKASSDKKQLDVGANLFIGNLDESVDERQLFDTFSSFGMLANTAKIARDTSDGTSKGYGFVSYTDFEASDAAVEAMNGQFLMNKAITVQYAFKKDGKGERHGTAAERLLAAQARKNNALPVSRPPPVFGAMGMFGPTPTPGVPGVPGFQQPPYQGQYMGAPPTGQTPMPPPPPTGFAPQPMPMGMSMGGMPQGPGMMPPPPPGFGPPMGMNMGMGMPGQGMMPPPPPGFGGPGGMSMGGMPPPPGFGAPMGMAPPQPGQYPPAS